MMMNKYTKMEVMVMVVGIIVVPSMFMAATAKDALECWDNIGACLNSVTSEKALEQCCTVVAGEATNERDCFCGVKPLLAQNATVSDSVTQLLVFCNSPSFDTICPDFSDVRVPPSVALVTEAEFREEPCWQTISNCIAKNVNNSESDPQFNTSSSSFNGTEFLCCPLIQETAITEKRCFCSVNGFIQENPSVAQNMTQLLSVCGMADLDILNDYCEEGEAPSPAPTPTPTPSTVPTVPTQGTVPDQVVQPPLGSTSDENLNGKTSVEASGANMMTITGSLSSFLVLMTYVLFH